MGGDTMTVIVAVKTDEHIIIGADKRVIQVIPYE